MGTLKIEIDPILLLGICKTWKSVIWFSGLPKFAYHGCHILLGQKDPGPVLSHNNSLIARLKQESNGTTLIACATFRQDYFPESCLWNRIIVSRYLQRDRRRLRRGRWNSMVGRSFANLKTHFRVPQRTAPSAGRAVASSIISPPPRIAVMGFMAAASYLAWPSHMLSWDVANLLIWRSK